MRYFVLRHLCTISKAQYYGRLYPCVQGSPRQEADQVFASQDCADVHAALPNYLEMFQQLSDFQQNLSSELLNLSTPLIVPMTASAEKLATENRAMQQDVPERKTLAFQQLVRQPSTWQPSVRVQPLRFCNPYVAGGTSQAPFEKEGDEPAGRKETLSIDLKTLFQ